MQPCVKQASTVHLPILNYDVLLLISSFISGWKDLWALMNTCKVLRNGAMPLLLSRPIELRTRHITGYTSPPAISSLLVDAPVYDTLHIIGAKNIDAFCRFLLADPDRRPGLLKELCMKFVISQPSPSAPLLYQILRRCSRLRRVHLPSCEKTLNLIPKIMAALMDLTELREVEVRKTGPLTEALIKSMDAPITTFHFNCCFDFRSIANQNPTQFLSNFTRSLTTLVANTANWNSAILNRNIQFPLVTDLRIYRSHIPQLGVLMQVFPNLKSLIFEESLLNTELAEDLELIRATSRESIRVGCPRWTQLNNISGEVDELYVLAGWCKTLCIRLWFHDIDWLGPRSWFGNINSSPQKDRFRTILSDYCPVHLDVMFRLRLEIEAEYQCKPFESLMNSVTQAVTGSAVEHLDFMLSWDDLYWRDEPISAEVVDRTIRDICTKVEVEALFLDLAQKTPSLKTISISRQSNSDESE